MVKITDELKKQKKTKKNEDLDELLFYFKIYRVSLRRDLNERTKKQNQ